MPTLAGSFAQLGVLRAILESLLITSHYSLRQTLYFCRLIAYWLISCVVSHMSCCDAFNLRKSLVLSVRHLRDTHPYICFFFERCQDGFLMLLHAMDTSEDAFGRPFNMFPRHLCTTPRRLRASTARRLDTFCTLCPWSHFVCILVLIILAARKHSSLVDLVVSPIFFLCKRQQTLNAKGEEK